MEPSGRHATGGRRAVFQAGVPMDHYQRLQVDRKASQEVIKSAYRALLKQIRMHPDLGGDEAAAKAVNEAYAVLSDPEARREYDRILGMGETQRVLVPETRYLAVCPWCGTANRIREEAVLHRARCGACHRKLQPRRPPGAEAPHQRAFRLGLYLFEKGLLDRSLREFQDAVRLRPGQATFRYWLGRCYYQKRTFDKAAVEFKVAVSLKPDSFQFQFWLGQSFYQMGDLPAAAGAFEQAAARRPDYGPTFHRLGSIYYHLQRYEHAVEAFSMAVRLDPHSLQSRRWLGLACYAAGHAEQAREAFRTVERMAPGDAFADRYLQRLAEASA